MLNMKAMPAANGAGLAAYLWKEATQPYMELADEIAAEVRQDDADDYLYHVNGLIVALGAVGEQQYRQMIERLADPDVDEGVFSRTTESLAIIWRQIGQTKWAEAISRIIDARDIMLDERGVAVEIECRLADVRADLGVEYRRDTAPELAKLLSINPHISPRLEDLRHLLSGGTAEGQDIPGKKRSATLGSLELIFSADKSVSVVFGLASPGERQAIIAAQRAAVDRAMHQIADKVGFIRNRRDGLDKRDPADVTWVQWQHRMSRRGDPQLHTHVSLINVVRSRVDPSKVGTLDTFLLHGFYPTVRETYHRALTQELGKLGLAVEFDAKVPAAVIRGVPSQVLRHFSGRTADAERWLQEKLGPSFATLTPHQRSNWLGHAAAKTRPTKRMFYVPGNGHAAWHARAAGAGYVPPPRFIDPQALQRLGISHVAVQAPAKTRQPAINPRLDSRYHRETGIYDEGVRLRHRI